jgi:hypothetical protein
MLDGKAARHTEIRQRYARRRRKRPRPSLGALRIRDLNRLFDARYGRELADDDAGRGDALIMAHHLAALSGDPRKRIGSWLRLRAPWMSLKEAEAVLVETMTRPQRWRADKLAWRLRLIEADRARLRITTIGAVDVPRLERIKRRKAKARLYSRQWRAAKGAKPRVSYLAGSISRIQPWRALKMSRAAWYRAGKPTA